VEGQKAFGANLREKEFASPIPSSMNSPEPSSPSNRIRDHQILTKLRDELLANCKYQFLYAPVASSPVFSHADELAWYANLMKDLDIIEKLQYAIDQIGQGSRQVSSGRRADWIQGRLYWPE
jgi:hypothetical protein